MLALVGGHGEDDGLGALEGVVGDVHILDGLAHAGNHGGEVLDVAHLLHLLDLVVEIPQGELVLGQLFLELAGLFLIKLLLGLFYQGDHVSHAQDAVCDALGVEHIQRFQLFAGGNELDGFSHYGLDGKGGTATGVTVHLGEDHAVKVQAVVEGLGGLNGILAGHGVNDEEGFRGLDGLVQGRYLVHQLLVHGQAAGGIHNDHAVSLGLGLGDGAARNLDGVLLPFLRIDGNLDAFSEHLELLDGGRAEGIAGGEEHLHAPLGLQVQRQLAGEGGFTGAVKTGYQHYAGIALDVNFLRGGAHEFRELVVHDLHHHLLGLHGREHVGADGLVLYAGGKVLGHLITYVGIQEGLADVLDGFGYIDFGDFSFTLQYLERPFQPFAQVLEHIFLFKPTNLRAKGEKCKSAKKMYDFFCFSQSS